MSIQWYPGHMHKARKQIKEALPKVDLVIEILDARLPHSSENPVIAGLRGNKPCIKVLSKSDLADPDVTLQWQQQLETEKGVKSLALTTQQPSQIRQLPDLCRKLLPAKDKNYRTIHAMIVGIPNAGKSTLINILAGRTAVKVGNEPAVTKQQQLVKINDNLTLWDTPGILWPKIDNPNSGYRLATSGAIKVTAMDYEDVAYFAAEYLLKMYPDNLQHRFKFDAIPQSEHDLLGAIAHKRGSIKAGGRVDYHKVAEILLTELRSGALGRISLETPAIIAQEEAQAALQKNNT